MTVTDPASRLAVITDEALTALHERLDTSSPADAAMVEAHHHTTTEMLKRGLDHGHESDQWSRAVILVDEAEVESVDDLDFPGDLSQPLVKALADGGTVQVLLTVDGYVLKADPGVNAVHVDSIMGGKRPKAMLKRIVERAGRFVVMAEESDREFGTYDTREEAEERLKQVERFSKESTSHKVPDAVRSAARRAMAWIGEGKAGDGFTSVGRNRARQLAEGDPVGHETLVKMRAYFARHGKQRADHDTLKDGEPTPWRVAWDAWGGDAGRTWVNQILGPIEKRAIPESIADIHINLKNRQHAIDEYLYGPMNPDAPGDYWQRLGDVWGVDAEDAETTRCGNCAAFNRKPEILDAIAEGISDEGDAVVDAAYLGYCELFEFKCAAARSCSAWLTGGPLVKATEEDIDEDELLQTMDADDLSDFGSYAYLSDEMQKRGNPESLRDYWRGGGGGRIDWGTGGDFTACVEAVSNYMDPEQAKGYCAIRHQETTGMWPGEKGNRTKKSVDLYPASFTLPDGSVYTFSLPEDSVWSPMHKHGAHDQKAHGRWAAGSGDGGVPGLVADKPPSSSRSPQGAAEAVALRARAEALEPEITGKISSLVTERGGTMEGLEQRLKTTDSLARKIDADSEDYGGDRAAAAAGISDAVRYTGVIGDAMYTDGARSIIRDLEADGYDVRAKNFWAKGDDYQGINIKAAKNGVTVELQLHTPSSLDIKEGRSTKGTPIRSLHDTYEVMRTSTSKAARWKAWSGMVRLAAQIPTPQNYEMLLEIGTLAVKTFE